MRSAVATIGWFLCASTLHAQTLDIAGTELHIGEDATVAMTWLKQRVPSGISVSRLHISRGSEPVDTTSEWVVTKDSGRAYVASIGVTDGLISSIVKYYDLGDGSDIATVYTAALRDAQRDQIAPCTTTAVRLSGVVQMIRTTCGSYELDLSLSWTNKEGPGRSKTSIAVMVHAIRPRRN